MADILCSASHAIAKAGANVNTTITASSGTLAAWGDEAEDLICGIARSDVVTNFASLTPNGRVVLQGLCSAMIAQKIIGYEPEAIGTGGATLRLNVLENDIKRGIALIKEDKNKTYLGIT